MLAPKARGVALAALVAFGAPAASAVPVAFPGAEGFGRFASGGRGGEVYVVTNLNNSGAGSLREAVTSRTASVPRTVVFAVSGTIYLESTLRITQGNLTIAGQTAPGDGICLAYRMIDISNSSNVIIRFLRARLGDVAGVETDAFTSRYASNVIIDHCSFSWSVDETASAYDNTDLTMQWCFVTESLRDSVHSKGAHGYGAIWGGLGASFHHNLIAHHDSRNPRFNGARTHGTDGELVDMRNNVIYNWRGNSTYGGEPTDAGLPSRQNMVNNVYKNGPATSTGTSRYRILEPTENTLAPAGATFGLFYVAGNHTTASSTVSADNWAGGVQAVTAGEIALLRAPSVFAVPEVITQTALDAYPLVLAYGGCRLPVRDSIDTRIVTEVGNGTATYRGSKGNYPGIIDSQADVGGWPALASLPAPTDTDSDGMPDAWETSHGLNPADPADRNLTDAEGYTRLEIYLNSLALAAFPVPQIGTPPSSVTVSGGNGFTLSTVATGPGPLSYQWYKDGDPLAGQTAASYAVATASSADIGTYHVAVTNAYGSTSSASASVNVTQTSPSITSEPVSATVSAGQPVTFTVVATGSAPLAYQWYRGASQPIDGATAASYTIGSVATGHADDYHVVITNSIGSAISATVTLTVIPAAAGGVFATDFSTSTIHAASPQLTATSTNWYVMSSKNATGSSVGDNPATGGVVETRPLDLTMSITGSGVVETAARFAAAPHALAVVGDVLRARMVFTPTNVRTVGLGFFDSGNVPPHTGLISSQLTSSATALATGGTQGWRGYRVNVSTASTAGSIEARLVQPGTNNASQSLIIPGTSSSAPSVAAIGTVAASATSATFTDGQAYTLTATLTRTTETAFTLAYTVHAGTDTTATALFSTSATTTAAGALPADVATAFDALGIGYRNVNDASVSHLTVTSLRVEFEPVTPAADPYENFLALYSLDPAGNGADGADPDADGLSNVLEFVLGGSPVDPASAPLPVLALESTTEGVFSFARHLDADDLFALTVEQSTDLAVWSALTNGVGGVTVTVAPFDAGHELVTLRAPISAPQVFFRLRATRQ